MVSICKKKNIQDYIFVNVNGNVMLMSLYIPYLFYNIFILKS